jgi:hypothetical protein
MVKPGRWASRPGSRVERLALGQAVPSGKHRGECCLVLLLRTAREVMHDPVRYSTPSRLGGSFPDAHADKESQIGTTRSRVNFFMNRFRKLGFIDYNGAQKIDNSPERRAPRLTSARSRAVALVAHRRHAARQGRRQPVRARCTCRKGTNDPGERTALPTQALRL